MSPVNPAKLPRTAEYIARLPDGLASFPECQVKASVYRNTLGVGRLRETTLEHLPAELLDLVENPPPVSDWVSEVHTFALYQAIWDERFETEQELLEFLESNARRLTNSAMYSSILSVVSPETLLRGADYRWKGLRRGTDGMLVDLVPGSGTILIKSPPGLWDALSYRVLSVGVRVALESSGAKGAEVTASEVAPGRAHFVCTWEPVTAAP